MGLEVYYPADIRNALLAAEQAVNATAHATGDQDDPFTSGFLAGYRAALTTLAVAFGLASDGSREQAHRLAAQPEPLSAEKRAALLAAPPFSRQR